MQTHRGRSGLRRRLRRPRPRAPPHPRPPMMSAKLTLLARPGIDNWPAAGCGSEASMTTRTSEGPGLEIPICRVTRNPVRPKHLQRVGGRSDRLSFLKPILGAGRAAFLADQARAFRVQVPHDKHAICPPRRYGLRGSLLRASSFWRGAGGPPNAPFRDPDGQSVGRYNATNPALNHQITN